MGTLSRVHAVSALGGTVHRHRGHDARTRRVNVEHQGGAQRSTVVYLLNIMSNSYEIEVKSLLGSKENCDKLKSLLQSKKPETKLVAKSKQLNHYFIGGDIKNLYKVLSPFVSKEQQTSFKHIIDEGNNPSVRTRQTDGKVIFVIKASIGSSTSSNGVERIEFESIMFMTLDELDKKIIESGYEYQAKWSREREEYDTGDMHICIDKNAGYGYVAEFEKVIQDQSLALFTSEEIREFMRELGIEELPQDKLERMFDYYNKNWPDYYGTDKIFAIE